MIVYTGLSPVSFVAAIFSYYSADLIAGSQTDLTGTFADSYDRASKAETAKVLEMIEAANLDLFIMDTEQNIL